MGFKASSRMMSAGGGQQSLEATEARADSAVVQHVGDVVDHMVHVERLQCLRDHHPIVKQTAHAVGVKIEAGPGVLRSFLI